MTDKKILICDDDEGILDMLEMVLEDRGYCTIPEKNSLNIYNAIEKEQPDLVLLDLWMPVLSGDQVLRTLKSNPATMHLPVIIISASTDGHRIAINAGASEFVAKPFDVEKLVYKVQSLIN